jgi:hypothetical protein
MATPPDGPADRATRCPLCGGPNACGMAQGQDTCWCFTAQISPVALAAVPEESRDVCVCPSCAQATAEGRRTSAETPRI